MANVWKVGSRWDEYGSANRRIQSIFRRSGYVFVGSNGDYFNNYVEKDDYIAIADGFQITAIAKVLDEKPTDLSTLLKTGKIRFRHGEKERFGFQNPDDFEGWCYGVRVHIVDLSERIEYKHRGTFCSINNTEVRDLIVRLYNDKVNAVFDIASRTYRLKKTRDCQESDEYRKFDLLDGSTFYTIPIYQREYSWSEEQISRLVRDIFNGYWGADVEHSSIKKEPLFIGTMQLSAKRYISQAESEQDIIDGQQRTSTFLCFIKLLTLLYPNQIHALKDFTFDWLETRVNNGIEDTFLSEFCDISDISQIVSTSPNIYIRNCAFINEVFQQHTTDDSGKKLVSFDINDFCEYILNDIFFVAVETVAGLSKTIQIFNTINTAGLDLNGDDLFKVRFFEYLHDVCGESNDTFGAIGDVYKRIKDINSEWHEKGNNDDIVHMSWVRDAYKDLIISEYELPVRLYAMGTDTFFEQLFDILLNVQPHDDFGRSDFSRIKLSLATLNKIVDKVAEWNSSFYKTPEQLIAYKLVEKSRYSRYERISILMLMKDFSVEQVYELFLVLGKVYLCHSVYNSKVINEIHTFSYDIMRMLGKGLSFDEVKTFAEEKLRIAKQWEGHFKKAIFGNRVWQDMICCLSAYLDEIEEDNIDLMALSDKLSWGYDVEHIHAKANDSITIDENLLNCIGNLVLLEGSINKSIHDDPFNIKKLSYQYSHYASIHKIMKKEQWGIPEIEERRETEFARIEKFIWG